MSIIYTAHIGAASDTVTQTILGQLQAHTVLYRLQWCDVVVVHGIISTDTTATATGTAVYLRHSTRWPQYSHIKVIDLASCVKYCWIMPALATDEQLVLQVDSLLFPVTIAIACEQQLLALNRVLTASCITLHWVRCCMTMCIALVLYSAALAVELCKI
jgi:hypothetical protein